MKQFFLALLSLISLTVSAQQPVNRDNTNGQQINVFNGYIDAGKALWVPKEADLDILTDRDSTGLIWTKADGTLMSHNGVKPIPHGVPSYSDYETNTFVGDSAGVNNTYLSPTAGAQNTYIGAYAGYECTTGYAQVFVGYNAGRNNVDGHGNTNIGYQANYRNISGRYNITMGVDAGYRNKADRNIFIGYHVGFNALNANDITGTQNTFLASESAQSLTTGSNDTASGYQSMYSVTTGSQNTASGVNSLFNLTTGSGNNAVGYEAGNGITTEVNNTYMGHRAGYTHPGSSNVGVGAFALGNSTSTASCVFVGLSAGENATGSNATGIGQSAGKVAGNFSTFIGYQAGILTTGANNVFVGSTTGGGITTGTYNTIIGGGLTGFSSSLTNTLAIGAGGAVRIYSPSTGNVLIGTTTDDGKKFQVSGEGGFTGRITASDATLTSTPTTSAGGYDILTRNTSTGVVEKVTGWLSGSATLDFPDTATLTSSVLTITVTGAADGDVVSLGVPNASTNANSCFTAWVSATNTVSVKFNNYSSGSINPATGTFKVKIIK